MNLKKIGILSIILVLIGALAGCSTTTSTSTVSKIKVKAQLYPMEYLAKTIGGDFVEVTLATESKSAHHAEPTQQDIAALSSSQAFFYVGVGDVGVHAKELVDTVKDSGLKSYDVSKGVKTIDNDGEIDPHIWLSLKNMLIMAENVKNGLVEVDSQNKEAYEKNYDSLVTALKQLERETKTLFDAKKNKTFLVAHGAYQYLAQDYGLTQLTLTSGHDHDHEEGEAHEEEASAETENSEITQQQLVVLKENIDENNLKVLFSDASQDSEVSKKVATEFGLTLEPISTLEFVSEESSSQSYIDLYNALVEKIGNSMA